MITAAKINRLLIDKLSLNGLARLQKQTSREGFYQEILLALIKDGNIKNFPLEAGDRLVAISEQAHAFRQLNILQQASARLTSPLFPPHYQSIGNYYQALAIQR